MSKLDWQIQPAVGEPGANPLDFGGGYPEIDDIARRFRFESSSGSVWLHDERVMVMRTSVYEQLRTSLIEALGLDEARARITTMGYEAGNLDGRLAKKLRGTNDLQAIIAAGPQLFALKGLAAVDPVSFKVDLAEGRLLVEAVVISALEADLQIKNFGIGTAPACWFTVGHASGFFSWYLGKPVLFRELECRALGSPRCRIVGMPLEEFESAAADPQFIRVPAFVRHRASKVTAKARRIRKSAAKVAGRPVESLLGPDIVGASPGFRVAAQMLLKVAQTEATVLFAGQSGVGKEVFSRALHALSRRAEKPFIAVNCAAIPDALIESELFGVERGAYTGAVASRGGRFERAHGGTLFLDEVTSLTLPAQGKLLRVLQEGELERLGGKDTRKVDVRIAAATNVDLRDEVAAGRFREDLFYRLNVFPIYIPPLRSRREDIPLMMEALLEKYSRTHRKSLKGFSNEAMDALLSYEWPGNIRELENVIERAVILANERGLIHVTHLFTSGEHISAEVLSPNEAGTLAPTSGGLDIEKLADKLVELDLGAPLQEMESALINAALRKTGGKVAPAARALGMSRGQLDYRLKKNQIQVRNSVSG